jgi:hypothetical protein
MNSNLMLLRARIEHEDNLINHRLSAMVGSQSFLITGFAVSLNAPVDFHASKYEAAHRALTHLLPVAGIAIVLVSLLSLIGAMTALSDLHHQCDRYETPDDPPIHSSRMIRRLGNSTTVGVPIIFLALWIVLTLNSF